MLHQCVHKCFTSFFTKYQPILISGGTWIELNWSVLDKHIYDESLILYMTADGKWHPLTNSSVSTSLPGPTRNASTGVPPVCFWRAQRKADGAGGYHSRGQGWGQVSYSLVLTLGTIFWSNKLRLKLDYYVSSLLLALADGSAFPAVQTHFSQTWSMSGQSFEAGLMQWLRRGGV